MNSFILWGLSVTNPVPIWLKFLVHISPVRAVSITPAPFPALHSSTSAPTPTSLVVSAPTPAAVLASAPLMSLLIRPWMTLGFSRTVASSYIIGMELEEATDVSFGKYFSKGPSGMLRKALF